MIIMLNDTFANRLRKALQMNNMTQTELANKSGLDKSLISNYLSGNYKAKQDKITLLANILNVSETWLMGFDILKNEENNSSEFEILFDKYKNVLSDKDKQMITFIIEQRKKEIDEQEN